MKYFNVIIGVLFLLFIGLFPMSVNAEGVNESDSEEITEEELEQFLNALEDTEVPETEFPKFTMESLGDLDIGVVSDGEIPHRISTCAYNRSSGKYEYKVDGKIIFTANITDYSVISEFVKIESKESFMEIIYKDGEIYKPSEENLFVEPGVYKIEFMGSSNNGEKENISFDSVFYTGIMFRILPKQVNDLGIYSVPVNYAIDSVKFNGSEIDSFRKSSCFLDDDGQYEIHMYDRFNKKVTRTVSFEKDTQAPVLEFDKPVQRKNMAPLSFSCPEEKTKIVCMNGTNVYNSDNNTLTSPGKYRITVTDRAGNQRIYEILIIRQYKFFSKGMIIGLIAIVICVAGGMIYVRRDKYEV